MYKKNEWLLSENKKVVVEANINKPLDPRNISYHLGIVKHGGASGLFETKPSLVELQGSFEYEFEATVARPERLEGYYAVVNVGRWDWTGDNSVGNGMLGYDNFDFRLTLPPHIAKELFEQLLRWSNAPKDPDLFPAVENSTGLTGKLWDFSFELGQFEQGIPTDDKTITFRILSASF